MYLVHGYETCQPHSKAVNKKKKNIKLKQNYVTLVTSFADYEQPL